MGTLGSGGQTLPNEVRNFYEPRFGYDFSNVKVHTNSLAAKSAQSINALAYTSGNSIVFNEGQYASGTENGRRLLGHELTHVIQQKSSIKKNKFKELHGRVSNLKLFVLLILMREYMNLSGIIIFLINPMPVSILSIIEPGVVVIIPKT